MKFFLLILAAWCCLALRAMAQSQFGDFYYTNDAVSVTITGRATTNQILAIPPTINGLPVTSIQPGALLHAPWDGPESWPKLSVAMPFPERAVWFQHHRRN